MKIAIGGMVFDTRATPITLTLSKEEIASIAGLTDKDPGEWYFSGPGEWSTETLRKVYETQKELIRDLTKAEDEIFGEHDDKENECKDLETPCQCGEADLKARITACQQRCGQMKKIGPDKARRVMGADIALHEESHLNTEILHGPEAKTAAEASRRAMKKINEEEDKG